MRISIYHGTIDIHYEILGYLIDYFKLLNIDINIYARTSNVGLDWKEYYEILFNINLTFLNIEIFNPNNYDLIFLITDDDIFYKNEWLDPTKVVCIDHTVNIRRAPVYKRIGTRFFHSRPSCPWALPCYRALNKVNKLEALSQDDKIHVLCVGVQNTPPNVDSLINLFENFNDVQFHIVSRYVNSKDYIDFPNIKTYWRAPTNILFDIAKKASYVLCFQHQNNAYPIKDSMSGAIPLSFSYGCQLIIPGSWQHYYNFKSVISYDDKSRFMLTKEINLDSIFQEQYDMIAHRNVVLDDIINSKFPNFKLSYQVHNWFLKLCNILGLSKPNIFVETGTYLGECIDMVKNNFREIHSIELIENFYNNTLEKFKNERNIYLYLGDSGKVLKNLCKNIVESAIFYLDAYVFRDSSFNREEILLRELKVLGKRNFIDIIIINDINKMHKSYDVLDKMIKAYNRQCTYYMCEDVDRMVIIPQK